MKPFAAFLLALATVAATLADDFDTWSEASPDKALFAIERRIANPSEPTRLDLDGFAVFICRAKSGAGSVVTPDAIIARRDFPLALSATFAGALIPSFCCSRQPVPAAIHHGISRLSYFAPPITHFVT
jgi:hypothetical protein